MQPTNPPIPPNGRATRQRASHAFILTLRREAKGLDVTAMDIAKRWLDDVRAAKHLDLTWKPVQ